MKTESEMLNKLKRLANEISQKNRNLENLRKKHIKNTQGRNNGKYVYGQLNKPTYTNANYMRNVNNAIRIVYRERKPLLEKYNKAAAKYRQLTGLPVMKKRGKEWTETVSFTRSKNTRRPNYIPINTRRLYEYRNQYKIGTGSGGNAYSNRFNVHVHPYKFYPNVQLLNALGRRIKALNTISKATHQAWSRPRFVSGSFVGRRARNIMNELTGESRNRSPIRNSRKN